MAKSFPVFTLAANAPAAFAEATVWAVTPLPTASRSDAKPVRRRHSTRQAKPTPPRRTFLTPWPYIPSAVRAIFC